MSEVYISMATTESYYSWSGEEKEKGGRRGAGRGYYLCDELMVRGVTDGTNTSGTFALTISSDIVKSITNYTYSANPNFIVIPIGMKARIKKLTVTGDAVTVHVKVSTDANAAAPTFNTIASFTYNPAVDGQLTLDPEIIVRAFMSINDLSKISTVAIRFDWTQSVAGVSNLYAVIEITDDSY
jgi:hypothetical protein